MTIQIKGSGPYDYADGTEAWNWDANSLTLPTTWYKSYNWDGDGTHDHNPGGEPWTPGATVDPDLTAAAAESESKLDVTTRSDECLIQACVNPSKYCCMYTDISGAVTANSEWTLVARFNVASSVLYAQDCNNLVLLFSKPDFTQAGKELYYNSLFLYVWQSGVAANYFAGPALNSYNAGTGTVVFDEKLTKPIGPYQRDLTVRAYHANASADVLWNLSTNGGRSWHRFSKTSKNPTGFTHIVLAAYSSIAANDIYPINGLRYIRIWQSKVFK